MTMEEKIQALNAFCDSQYGCGSCPLSKSHLSCDFSIEDASNIDELYDTVFPTVIKNSGEAVNHPKHYGREGAMECIDEMVLVFGVEATMHFCLLNAWKYRYRSGAKGGEEDMKKSDWYLAKYKELKGGD